MNGKMSSVIAICTMLTADKQVWQHDPSDIAAKWLVASCMRNI